jgi:hypothetical protein
MYTYTQVGWGKKNIVQYVIAIALFVRALLQVAER